MYKRQGIIQIIHEDVILLLEGFTQLMRRLPTNSNDMNDIKIAEKKTFKKFDQDNFVYNTLASLREKINAGTRKSK